MGNYQEENPKIGTVREVYTSRALSEAEKSALRRLALPRWFMPRMLSVVLADRPASEAQEQYSLLKIQRRVEAIPGIERYRVPERFRVGLLAEWGQPERRAELKKLSDELARYCAAQAKSADNPALRDEWRYEQLYHLAIAAPGRAMLLMRTWFDQAVEKDFDLNQGYRWLQPLEERREWLAILEAERKPAAGWTATLDWLREYLSARSYWSDEWFKTINYLPRQQLQDDLDEFFQKADDPASPWILSIYAQGGHGKTSTLDWLLARYALPRGFICARLQLDKLPAGEQAEILDQPERILPYLAESLNAQRAHKIEALERQAELRGDPVGNFTMVLRQAYPNYPLVFFLDSLETLTDYAPQPGTALLKLVTLLRQIKEGDKARNGTIPGFARLQLVVSSRDQLSEKFGEELHEALGTSRRKTRLNAALTELELSGFSLEEGTAYLSEKRKLTDGTKRLIKPILKKATDDSSTATTPGRRRKSKEIVPLKLALYADMVNEKPNITPKEILDTSDLDMAGLADKVIADIEDPVTRWLLRYGVIFRRLDDEAMQILMPFLEQVQAQKTDMDNPQLDPAGQTIALEQARATDETGLIDLERLLDKLTRYSWVDRQGDFILFKEEVRASQLKNVARLDIFGILQQAAFQHFAERADRATDPETKATFLREAIYHSLQLGGVTVDNFVFGSQGVREYWSAQFEQYRSGPGPVLWAVVDEMLRVNRQLSAMYFEDGDWFEAYLALSQLLLAESEQPFMSGQLSSAESYARKALALAEKAEDRGRISEAQLTLANIALACRKPTVALDLAARSIEQADNTGQEVEAMKVLGRAEAANSLWAKALETIRRAYDRSKQLLGLGRTQQEIRLELIERLLGSSAWREAPALLKEALESHPDDPATLEIAALVASKLAHLQEAADYYRRAASVSDEAQAARLTQEAELVAIYQGELAGEPGDEIGLKAVVLAAARANWLEMERLLRVRLAATPEEQTLDVINTLLNFYLEVTGDWRQVRALLERGARWVARRPKTDPALARFSVLNQYVEFMGNPLILKPEMAEAEVERRFKQIEGLQTPEERVRAKGYLLLVRFYGNLKAETTSPEVQAAVAIYRKAAARALTATLDILLKLAPIDQVDILRTLAAVPGWSSQLVNEVAPDPAERSPLPLLKSFFEPPTDPAHPGFLAQLASEHDLEINDKLATLQKQIEESGADWAILYSSFARLLAAFGQRKAGLGFLETAPVNQAKKPILFIHDQASLLEWPAAQSLIEAAIKDLEAKPEAANLYNELMLIWAWLGLSKTTGPEAASEISIWLTRLGFLDLYNPGNGLFAQEYYLLLAVTRLRLGDFPRTLTFLRQALSLAEGFGNTVAIEIISNVKGRLEAQARLAAGQPQQQFQAALDWLEKSGQALEEVQKLILDTPDRSPALEAFPVPPMQVAPPLPGAPPAPEIGMSLSSEISAPQELEILLSIKQLDDNTAEVIFVRTDQDYIQARWTTSLKTLKRLLPQGKTLTELPDTDYWQKLLNPETNQGRPLDEIGAALLDDLLPSRSRGRKQLEALLKTGQKDQLPIALRLLVEGAELERLPWGLLYHAASQQWLARRFRFSYNRPNGGQGQYQWEGETLAVQPIADRPDPDGKLFQLAALYPAAGQLYGPELLGQANLDENESNRIEVRDLPRPLKVLHLMGDLSEVNEIEGIYLSLGRFRTEQTAEPLTADALAHQLRLLGVSRSLIILEPLSTGATFEDSRVLLLRNNYAAALARLGTWTVLAIGPRPDTAPLVRQLLTPAKLVANELEDLVLQAYHDGGPELSLQDQFGLYYPVR